MDLKVYCLEEFSAGLHIQGICLCVVNMTIAIFAIVGNT